MTLEGEYYANLSICRVLTCNVAILMTLEGEYYEKH